MRNFLSVFEDFFFTKHIPGSAPIESQGLRADRQGAFLYLFLQLNEFETIQ